MIFLIPVKNAETKSCVHTLTFVMQRALFWVAKHNLTQFLDPATRANLRLTCCFLARVIHVPRTLEPFATIEPAKEYARNCKGLRVWAMDIWSHKRDEKSSRFYAGTLSSFLMTMEWYEKNGKERCFYEIIHSPDDNLLSQTGTHAYLDLEFYRRHCKHSMTDEEILDVVTKDFMRTLRQEFDPDKTVAILPQVLTAHNKDKFSSHVVFRVEVDGVLTVFPSNFAVGAVVRKWEYEHERDGVFYYEDDEGTMYFVSDGGVYTLRRQIRTMNSTKMRQNRYLTSSRNGTQLENTMIQYHDYGTSREFRIAPPPMLTDVKELDGQEPVRTSVFWGAFIAMKKPGKRGLTNGDAGSSKRPKLDKKNREGGLLSRCCDWIVSLDPGSSIRGVTPSGENNDKYMFETTSRLCFVGTVKCAYEHSSNHVYYTIRLGDMHGMQYCHDPNCAPLGGQQVEMPQSLKEHMNIACFYGIMVKNLLTKP